MSDAYDRILWSRARDGLIDLFAYRGDTCVKHETCTEEEWKNLRAEFPAAAAVQQKPCTSPNGRTDGHMSFVTMVNGSTTCAFCYDPYPKQEIKAKRKKR